MIRLKNYSDKVKDLKAFRQVLFASLGDQLYSIFKKDQLLFEIFKNIDLTSKNLTADNSSLEKSCEKVLKHFGIQNVPFAKIRLLTNDKLISPEPDKKDTLTKFFHYILHLDKLPAHTFAELEEVVKKDLAHITNLMSWYESHSFIQEVNAKGVVPRNHEHRILYDFYKRCQIEQREILNYYLGPMKKRALSKAFHFPHAINTIFAWTDQFRDRPYKYALAYYTPYFDCRKIDVVSHRVEEMDINDDPKMISLYKNDKVRFYRIVFRKTPAKDIFNSIFFYLSHLPLYNDRKPLFEELQTLFKSKKWFGFYALALTQIEGLFSEMFRVAFPKSDSNRKSLSDKVESIRPFYRIIVYFLDYYQYELPRLRNKFMHSGYDENLKTKSFDLLLDLVHLLRMFYEMDNPVVKIKKLHIKRSYLEFINYKDFASYFKLLNKLKPGQAKDLRTDIVQFEKDFLHEYCNVEYVCLEINQNLPDSFSNFNEKVRQYSSRIADKINFDTMSLRDISRVLKDGTITDEIATSFRISADNLDDLKDYRIFLASYRKFLPSLKPEIADILTELANKFLSKLNTVESVSETLKLLNSQNPDLEDEV